MSNLEIQFAGKIRICPKERDSTTLSAFVMSDRGPELGRHYPGPERLNKVAVDFVVTESA